MKETENDGKTSTEIELIDIRKRLEEFEEHLLATRETAVLQSETLPHLNHQFKRLLLEKFALRQSLLDIEKEVTLRHTSFEHAMRDRARSSENAGHMRKYMNAALLRYRSVADQNIILTEEKRKLEKELEAKGTIIQAVDTVIQEVNLLLERKQLAPDVLAELKRIVSELPRPMPTPTPPEELPLE